MIKLLITILVTLKLSAIDIQFSNEVSRILSNKIKLGDDLDFKKHDRKISYYVTTKSESEFQVIAILDTKKNIAKISRFISIKNLPKGVSIDRISIIPDNYIWGFDSEKKQAFKINTKSGEVSTSHNFKITDYKIIDFVVNKNRFTFLVEKNGLYLMEYDVIRDEILDIKFIIKEYNIAKLNIVKEGEYLIYLDNGKSEFYLFSNNSLRNIASWKHFDLNGISLLDNAKTIAYINNNQFFLRELPEALIVWGYKEWLLVVFLVIFTLLGFVILFYVIKS